jgi:flagellar basal body P-ring formation protein FlgA
MIRTVLSAALIALATPAVAADAPPTLKPSVSVTGDIVRIGDLVENAGAVANVAIFRSPDLGTVGSVPVEKVLQALRANRLFGVDPGTLTEIEVARTGHAIGSKEIEGRIAATFARQNGLGDAGNLVVALDRDIKPVTIEAKTVEDLSLLRANLDPRSGRFEIVFEAPTSAGIRRAPLRYTGTVTETVEMVTLTRAVARGDILKNSDVTIERRNKSELPADAVNSVDLAVGLAVRQQLKAGQPLRRADIMKPEIVRRDENVALVFEAPGILLTTRGKALESGTEGDVINVLNIQSKRTVRGVVTGPGRVTIILDSARVIPDAKAAPQVVATRNTPE